MGTHYSICCNEEKYNDNNINYQINITQNINEIILKENKSYKDSNIIDYVKISSKNRLHDNEIIKFSKDKNSVKSTHKELTTSAITNNVNKIDTNYFSEKTKKQYCIKINFIDFKVQEEKYNFEKNINNFSSESLLKYYNLEKNFTEDKDIIKIFDEWNYSIDLKNQFKKFFEIENNKNNTNHKSNVSINENIFLSNTTNNNMNYLNCSTQNKTINEVIKNNEFALDLNFFPQIIYDKDNTLKANRFELFPVYPDLLDLDKIYFGEWSLNLEKLESLIKISKEDNTEINIIEIKNLNLIFDFEGSGILIKKNSIYEGVFRKDLLNGPGRIINYSGDIFKGIFENGNLDKFGIFENKEKNKYEGEFKNNKMNGFGKETFNDGSIFTGNYINNKKNGKGKFIWSDGSKYEGDILNNEIDGFGNFVWPNGLKYIGEWKKGKMNGKGIFDFNNGEYYEGYFKDNKKHGKGKYIWNSNKYFEGYWSENIQNGEGIFIQGNKEIRGFWKDGKMIKKL